MKGVLVALASLLACWLKLAEPAYESRGWRPRGPLFNPVRPPPPPPPPQPQQHLPQPGYEPAAPGLTPTPAQLPAFQPATARPGGSRELKRPTALPAHQPDEEFETNPALAIANSFAFNRPIYVYNSFPYLHPAAAYSFLAGGHFAAGPT